MAGEIPGLIPKAALTTSRLVYYPFTIPTKLNNSALAVGGATHSMVAGVNAAMGNAYMGLEPKGPAKALAKLFVKVDESVKISAGKAERNEKVFWGPFSEGTRQVGQAVAGPGAYYYAKKAGSPDPSNPDVIRGLLEMKLFQYPPGDVLVPPPPPAEQGAPAPAPEGAPAPAPEGQAQAAEGAAQAQPAA